MLQNLVSTAYSYFLFLWSNPESTSIKRQKPCQMQSSLWERLAPLPMPNAPEHVVQKGLETSPFDPSQKICDTHILICVPKGLNTKQLFEVCGKDATFVPSCDHQGVQTTYWCYVALNPFGRGCSENFVAKQVESKGCAVPTEVEVFLAILTMQDLNKDSSRAPLFNEESSQAVFARCATGENVIIGGTKRGFETYQPGIISAGTAPTIRFNSN